MAQWVKGWLAELAVPGLILAWGGNLFIHKWVPLHTAFHYMPLIILICQEEVIITSPSIPYT